MSEDDAASSFGDGAEEDEDDADEWNPSSALLSLAQYGTVCPIPLQDPVAAQAAEIWAYIAQRLDRLKTTGRSPATKTPASHGRIVPRWNFDATAKLSWEGNSVQCQITDVSAGGLGLYADRAPPTDTPVIVEVAGITPVRGRLVNVKGHQLGLRLDMPLAEQVAFVRHMASMIAAPMFAGSAMPRKAS